MPKILILRNNLVETGERRRVTTDPIDQQTDVILLVRNAGHS